MNYKKLFSLDNWPDRITDFRTEKGFSGQYLGDRRGDFYVFTEPLELAINVALVTGRPLLLTGPPGAGKSTLARNVARVLQWRYYEEIITSQTRAQDLLWKVDLLKRLYDANAARGTTSDEALKDWERYITPGVLWWAFNPQSAAQPVKCEPPGQAITHPDTSLFKPGTAPVQRTSITPLHTPAVVMLDEIDKADPDLPNNLLQPLGRLSFVVTELGIPVESTPEGAPLIIVTTNGERSLPEAFIRRCIVIELKSSEPGVREKLAERLFGPERNPLYLAVSKRFDEISSDKNLRPLSTAEYIDAVEVCCHWGIDAGHQEFSQVVDSVLKKPNDRQMRRR